MKKLVLIIVLGVGFAFVSCEKQEIAPMPSNTADEVPRWEASSIATAPITKDTVSDPIITDVYDGGGITDPNDDEDANGRKNSKVN